MDYARATDYVDAVAAGWKAYSANEQEAGRAILLHSLGAITEADMQSRLRPFSDETVEKGRILAACGLQILKRAHTKRVLTKQAIVRGVTRNMLANDAMPSHTKGVYMTRRDAASDFNARFDAYAETVKGSYQEQASRVAEGDE